MVLISSSPTTFLAPIFYLYAFCLLYSKACMLHCLDICSAGSVILSFLNSVSPNCQKNGQIQTCWFWLECIMWGIWWDLQCSPHFQLTLHEAASLLTFLPTYCPSALSSESPRSLHHSRPSPARIPQPFNVLLAKPLQKCQIQSQQ